MTISAEIHLKNATVLQDSSKQFISGSQGLQRPIEVFGQKIRPISSIRARIAGERLGSLLAYPHHLAAPTNRLGRRVHVSLSCLLVGHRLDTLRDQYRLASIATRIL